MIQLTKDNSQPSKNEVYWDLEKQLVEKDGIKQLGENDINRTRRDAVILPYYMGDEKYALTTLRCFIEGERVNYKESDGDTLGQHSQFPNYYQEHSQSNCTQHKKTKVLESERNKNVLRRLCANVLDFAGIKKVGNLEVVHGEREVEVTRQFRDAKGKIVLESQGKRSKQKNPEAMLVKKGTYLPKVDPTARFWGLNQS